ncbi:MAG: hypothetical protein LBB16_04115 [Puniceicoccales bacterium]|nr:hypothetical protein [Puniceicoccales bacterium]
MDRFKDDIWGIGGAFPGSNPSGKLRIIILYQRLEVSSLPHRCGGIRISICGLRVFKISILGSLRFTCTGGFVLIGPISGLPFLMKFFGLEL